MNSYVSNNTRFINKIKKEGSDRDIFIFMGKRNVFMVLYQTREASINLYIHFASFHIEFVFASFGGITLRSWPIGCPCKNAVLISISFNYQFFLR